MLIRKLNAAFLTGMLLAAAAADVRGGFDIETTGSVWPSHAADGDWRVVDEGVIDFGITAEIAALISTELFDELLAPVNRVGALATPVPFSPPLEKAVIPQVEDVTAAAWKCVQGKPTR